LQTTNNRSGFSDYRTISSITWNDKNNVAQTTKIVVTVSNWHFNRDTLMAEKAPVCRLENIMVTLKLSSTVFESGEGAVKKQQQQQVGAAAAAASSSPEKSPGAAAYEAGGAVTSREGESYFFDKNGAIIPYSAFVALLDSDQVHDYLRRVKELYRGGSDNNDEDKTPVVVDVAEEDDDDDVVFSSNLTKKRRSEAIKKMRYGKIRKAIHFESDDEDDEVGQRRTCERQQSPDLGVISLLPAENEEEKNSSGEDGDKESAEDVSKSGEKKSKSPPPQAKGQERKSRQKK
jgi:hypothetical protein